MKQFSGIKDKFDTPAERKDNWEENGWWAIFLIVLNIIHWVFWRPELSHMYGFFAFCKWMITPVTLAGIGFIVYKNDPNYDKYKWWIGGLVVFLFIFSCAFRANYRFTDPGSRWDAKKNTSLIIYKVPTKKVS